MQVVVKCFLALAYNLSLLLGLVTNIPANMVVDQFGMIGLLTFIRAAETDPNLVSLALGADLTTLGLNLNSEVGIFSHPLLGFPFLVS